MSLKEPRSEWVMGIWGGDRKFGQKYTMLGANINQPQLGTIKKISPTRIKDLDTTLV